MKVFMVLVLAAATVSAFDLRANIIEPRNIEVPVKVPEGRIANGEDAAPGQFPYQVGLSLSESFFKIKWCGGSLISSEWVLTAAHCTENKKKATVHLGATERDAAEIKYTVYKKDFVVHPEWDPMAVKNDIALIKIPATSFSTTIRPVKLPAIATSYSSYAGDDAIASGWGRTSDDEVSAVKTLQYAEMEVVSNSICRKYYRRSFRTSNLCVATFNSGSTCQGDSGGPLVLSSSGVQVGLTSYGPSDGCANGNPVVFTRITTYLDWIQENAEISN